MAEPPPTPGLHHVTCIAGDPQANLDFWAETLGLRLVKRSINQDDASTYHFFYGDAKGTPGTSMTFFPWGEQRPGKVGMGQVARTAFRVPDGSLAYWTDRFDEYGVEYGDRRERFGEPVLPFRDPDGLPVELVETEVPADDPTEPSTGFVPGTAAIRGFHSVTLWVADPQPTQQLLRAMGLEAVGSEASAGDTGSTRRTRFRATGPVGQYVDVLPSVQSGRPGVGTVHHVAFQTPTDEDQAAMRKTVRSRGLRPTPQIDRHWFRSVYFREAGGILFELATNGPGYDSDEPADDLGGRLVLPGEFERRREEIQADLPAVRIPSPNQANAN